MTDSEKTAVDARSAGLPETSAERRARLLQTVERLPTGPGCYLFHDVTGAVAYAGKARSLQTRVRSYFTGKSADTRRAVRFVDRYVHAIEFISTGTEHEAFLLENKLIKRHKPAYNVKLRDDKDFLYVRVRRDHDYPALELARRPAKRGDATYHGPYASASSIRRTLRMLGGVIPLRDCTDREFAGRTRPCLKHEMGRCCAPCVDLVSREDYAQLLASAVAILEGRCEPVVDRLEREMAGASDEQRYEEAARLRDQIGYLRMVTAKQEVENITVEDADVLGLHRAGDLSEVVVLFFRRGALVSSAHHTLESELPDDELLAGFLDEFYGDARPAPREVLLPCGIPESEFLSDRLAERRDGAVDVAVPRRGPRHRLVALAEQNARDALKVAVEQRGHQLALLEGLARRLDLSHLPERIECYDVSNTGRTGIVASRVVFRHGEPERSAYRSYRIKTVKGQDDYGAMGETLRRRVKRRDTEPLPDLLIVDGGAAHLAVARRVLDEAGVGGDVALAALAKGGRRGRSLTLRAGERERLFLPDRDDPIELQHNTPEEYLLQRIRDEAHRFAIGKHRKLRSKQSLASRLDDVPGVGPVLKKRLLQQFGGTRALARADAAEVAGVRGVSPELARAILDHLQRTGG